VGAEHEAAGLQLAVELRDPVLEIAALDADAEVAEAEVQQPLVVPAGPFTVRVTRPSDA